MSAFYDDQPAPVRAVLIDAAADESERVLPLLHPEHAQTIAEIVEHLYWIDRLGWQNAGDVLRDYYDGRVTGIYLDDAADELATRLRAEAVTSAQFVASLLVLPARRSA